MDHRILLFLMLAVSAGALLATSIATVSMTYYQGGMSTTIEYGIFQFCVSTPAVEVCDYFEPSGFNGTNAIAEKALSYCSRGFVIIAAVFTIASLLSTLMFVCDLTRGDSTLIPQVCAMLAGLFGACTVATVYGFNVYFLQDTRAASVLFSATSTQYDYGFFLLATSAGLNILASVTSRRFVKSPRARYDQHALVTPLNSTQYQRLYDSDHA